MLGVTPPPRALAVRTILGEFSRVMDHLVCLAANLVDIGGLTNFWYAYQPREEIYGLLEACSGARLTVSYGRVGGLAKDVPENFVPWSRKIIEGTRARIADVETLVTRNKIVWNRFRGHGRRHEGAGARVGLDGAVPEGVGRAVRPAQGPAVRVVRRGGLRRADHDGGRQLREVSGPHRGDEAVAAHHRADPRQAPGRTRPLGRLPRDPPAEGDGLQRDGSAHLPLQARLRRGEGAGRARSTPRPRARTASSASTSSRTGAASRTA